MIDRIDQIIISILMGNARAPLTQVAKTARISQERATYRLKRLYETGIIKSAHVLIDMELLGFQQYDIFIQLMKSNKEKESQFLEFLKKYKVFLVSQCAGRWSFAFDLYVRSARELCAFMQTLLETWGDSIGDYATTYVERKGYYFKKFKGGNAHEQKIISRHPFSPDAVDWQIIDLLTEDARISYAAITKKVKLTANAVKDRIRKLTQQGVIVGYTVLIDYRKLGYESYGLQMKLSQYSKEIFQRIFHYFKEQATLTLLHQYKAGACDFEFRVFVENSAEVRKFIHDLNTAFYDSLTIKDFYLILDDIVIK